MASPRSPRGFGRLPTLALILVLSACGAGLQVTGHAQEKPPPCRSCTQPPQNRRHGDFSPFDWKRANKTGASAKQEQDRKSGQVGLLSVAYPFYRRVISSTDGPRCGHYPSCSAYALEAVGRWGFVRGSLLAFDRVTAPAGRSSRLRSQPIIVHSGSLRFYDPLEASDFWLGSDPREARP